MAVYSNPHLIYNESMIPFQLNVLCRSFFILLFLFSLAACSTSSYQPSDHYDGKEFFNPGVRVNKSLPELIKWQWQGGKEEWPDWRDDNVTPEVASVVPDGQVTLTFVNHASYLIQLKNLNILTDPIYSKRASPLSWIGPARHRAPGVAFENLPPIHVVFISHNHYDHLDLPTIKQLVKKHDPLFITSLGNKKYLVKAGATKVLELDWWEKTELPSGALFHVVQVQHWSKRSLFDTNEALWAGFVLEAQGMKIYFAGDSGYGPHYKEARKRFGPMDVSLLPIGAYEPRWFMKEQHLNPDDAIQAHQDLESKLSLGIHFGTFQLTNEGMDRPIEELNSGLQKNQIDPSVFKAPKNGETTIYQKQ